MAVGRSGYNIDPKVALFFLDSNIGCHLLRKDGGSSRYKRRLRIETRRKVTSKMTKYEINSREGEEELISTREGM